MEETTMAMLKRKMNKVLDYMDDTLLVKVRKSYLALGCVGLFLLLLIF